MNNKRLDQIFASMPAFLAFNCTKTGPLKWSINGVSQVVDDKTKAVKWFSFEKCDRDSSKHPLLEGKLNTESNKLIKIGRYRNIKV